MQWFADTVAGGIAYDLLKYLVGPLIMSALATTVLNVAFHKLNERRELIVFSLGTFFFCIILFFFIGTRPQQPIFVGGLQQIMTGPITGDDHDVVAVIGLNIINTGNMQSIVKNWRVRATDSSQNIYDATFVQMPPAFTFNNIPRTSLNQPTSVTFHSEDNLVEKTLRPIEVGSLAAGILFVEFMNVDQNVFRSSVTYNVYYEDVLSRGYTLTVKSTGQIAQVAAMPGLHTEMACPVPPGGLPKLQTNPLATPVPEPH